MKYLPLVLFLFVSTTVFAQGNKKKSDEKVLSQRETDELLSQLDIKEMSKGAKYELAMSACKCIDSISISNKNPEMLSKDIGHCIDEAAGAYLLIDAISSSVFSKKDSVTTINVNVSDNSIDRKKAYYEIERILMDSCAELQRIIASNDKRSINSLSTNKEALKYYYEGIEASEANNLKKAAYLYEKALKIDKNFAFAWDNLGITYRKLKKYQKAINAYEKSLEVSPNGIIPLQNLPVVYQYMKKPQKALDAYNKLTRIQPDNAEGYFGKGRILLLGMNKTIPALHNMCQAYNIYKKTNNPYRADAEKIMAYIHSQMSKTKEGKKKFNDILAQYDILIRFAD